MTDILTEPTKLFTEKDKIKTSFEFNISTSTEVDKIPAKLMTMLGYNLKHFLKTDLYHGSHIQFINNYHDAQTHNRRRPSIFILVDLCDALYYNFYNPNVYESYTTIKCGKTFTTIDFDEVRSNSGHTKSICKVAECLCIYNEAYPKFKLNMPLFGMVLHQIKHMLDHSHDFDKAYVPLLELMYIPINWNYFNETDLDLSMYYSITIRGKLYYISYRLLGVYVLLDTTITPIKKTSVVTDHILRLFLATCKPLNDNYKSSPIKCGMYYVEVTEYEPTIKSRNTGIKSNLTYKYYKSKINTTPPIVRIPKIFMKIYDTTKNKHETSINRFFIRKGYSLKRYEYDFDHDEVCIGYFETTIICNNKINYKPRLSPSVDISTNTDEYLKIIVLEPPIHIPSQLKPLKIIFKSNITNTDIIRKSLTDCYLQSIPFQNHTNQYNCIKIIKGIHTDMNRLDKSRHFNAVFLTEDYESSCYHLYIDLDNKINSITTIINIL